MFGNFGFFPHLNARYSLLLKATPERSQTAPALENQWDLGIIWSAVFSLRIIHLGPEKGEEVAQVTQQFGSWDEDPEGPFPGASLPPLGRSNDPGSGTVSL